MSSPQACARYHTVVATVATPSYAQAMLEMAASCTSIARFPCVVVQGTASFDALRSPLLHALPLPGQPLLPIKRWCISDRFGWKLTQLHKMRMLTLLLRARLHTFIVDTNWRFVWDPMPHLMRAAAAPTHASDSPPDVIALHDGFFHKLLNIGNMWVRSTALTVALAERAQNRSAAAWDQLVFNEELAFNQAFAAVG